MKSWIVHYKNKYPGARVIASEEALDVFRGDEHLIAIRKGGDGCWKDLSEEWGLSERHDLAPIPKESRVHKVVAGKIGFDEEAESRKAKAKEFEENGKIPSIDELKKKGFQFDQQGILIGKAAPKEAPKAE